MYKRLTPIYIVGPITLVVVHVPHLLRAVPLVVNVGRVLVPHVNLLVHVWRHLGRPVHIWLLGRDFSRLICIVVRVALLDIVGVVSSAPSLSVDWWEGVVIVARHCGAALTHRRAI